MNRRKKVAAKYRDLKSVLYRLDFAVLDFLAGKRDFFKLAGVFVYVVYAVALYKLTGAFSHHNAQLVAGSGLPLVSELVD